MNKKHLSRSIDSFADVATSQEEKGIVKYGKPLDPLDKYDWLQMAKEELVDGFKYLEAEHVKRQQIVIRIRKLVVLMHHQFAKAEINALLDELEGTNYGK
ncbi:hypothetical protein CWR48_04195 [Oceanobacillus arenosus]|uniref:Uncharacterized protein n=1 Tax=Oceanobacillus arenosus TaxID=1229153 RepID=A0A3D8PXZ9_9BACI|nr:hypothetical protein [Oceanobacillus arenosus]RDW21020.1 hypothetical protein CWR48_04195 [Oceanobacillus arenosus]